MMNKESSLPIKSIALRSLDDTKAFAKDIARSLENGDILLLKGDLGSGKTTFARYLIQSFYHDTGLLVQSPTFTICQLYEKKEKPPFWHFDFYRLEAPEEIFNAGYEEARQDGILLIEWPEKMAGYAPQEALLLHFTGEAEERFVNVNTNITKWQSFFREKYEGQ